jgi:hydrogenase nickel incorporation protein HypA/HybF
MHELSLCESIATTLRKHANGQSVTRVEVRIGHLRQVVPDALRFNWELVSDVPGLRGCQMVIEQVPAIVECLQCRSRTTLEVPVLVCGNCGSFDVELVSGEEFFVVSMDTG